MHEDAREESVPLELPGVDADLLDADSLRKRAEESLAGYVGDLNRIRTSLEEACKLVAAAREAG